RQGISAPKKEEHFDGEAGVDEAPLVMQETCLWKAIGQRTKTSGQDSIDWPLVPYSDTIGFVLGEIRDTTVQLPHASRLFQTTEKDVSLGPNNNTFVLKV